jgi:hypothetical protein
MLNRCRFNEGKCGNGDVTLLIENLVGEPCTRKEVGSFKCLSLGFGADSDFQRPHAKRVYRAWELGTYNCEWRFIQASVVLCGSRDSSDLTELNTAIAGIALGKLISLRQLNELDIRIDFDNGIKVDFLTVKSDEDVSFHRFCPNNLSIVFSARGGWKLGPSDKPWPEKAGDDI